jgi:hypothetical protein
MPAHDESRLTEEKSLQDKNAAELDDATEELSLEDADKISGAGSYGVGS